jgi:hypothetical protein
MPFKAATRRFIQPSGPRSIPRSHFVVPVLTVTVLSASLTAGSKLKVLLAAVFRIVSNLVILLSNDGSKLIKLIVKKLLLGTTST